MQKPPPRHHANSSPLRMRLLRALVLIAGLGGVTVMAGVAGVIGAYYYASPALPSAETIRDIRLEVPLRIFSRDGFLISEVGEHRRIPVSFDEVPPHVVHAFVAAEDRRFFVHPGIDYRGVLRALTSLVMTGEISGGGSTLTQQLARSYFLSLEQTFVRKLREAFLAYEIEQEFSKEQIMSFFLNKMFFGHRAYGVAAASQVYFNKNLAEISIAEAATLAGVLPAPSEYNPVASPAEATQRRAYVLGRMRSLGYITAAEYEEAMTVPMNSTRYGAAIELEAHYVAEMVRRDMLKRFGSDAYTAGYKVVTTLDSRLQKAANFALRNGLLEYTRRRGYRGPLGNLGLSAEELETPFADWPVESRQVLQQYVPGGQSLAVVTSLDEASKSASIVFADGSRDLIPWSGLSWANPFIDRQTFGEAPETVSDILEPADVIIVMPTNTGGWALSQVPEVQGAVVSLDPDDGAISSLVGGFDFATSKFNRVTQAHRQPGSSFKPFIYSAALEHGSTPATVILDTPVVISSAELEAVWRPTEYTGRFYGPTRLREALVRSMNLVSVRLLLFETGIGNTVRHIAKFGFGDAALPRNGSLALGAGAASPLDMVQGYAVLANGGYGIKPYVVDSIFGPDDEMVYRADPLVVCADCLVDSELPPAPTATAGDSGNDDTEAVTEMSLDIRPDAATDPGLFEKINAAPRAIPIQNAFLMQDMMRDVIRRGTGRRAMAIGRQDLSGKTGTSNDFRDAWFGGFNGDLATVAWVGYDDDLPLGPREEGSRTALPIWVDFMRLALKGVPEHQMPMPDGMVVVRIDPTSGCPATARTPNAIFEMFREGHVPECDTAAASPDIFNDTSGYDAPRSDDAEAGDDEVEDPESLF